MAEYIDRQELIENLNKFAPEHYNALVNQLIVKQPTVDVVSTKAFEQVKWERDTAIEQLWTYGIALCENKELVEVVRCKNCRYSSKLESLGHYICRKDYGTMHKEDDFCSKGKRKEGGD